MKSIDDNRVTSYYSTDFTTTGVLCALALSVSGGVMKIAVCVKQVPDSETRINLAEPSAELDRSGFTRVLNPYDAYAVEEAIQIKEKLGDDTEVTAIIIGGEQVMESVKKDCLAVGCDKAIRVTDELDNAEALQIAKVLTAVVKRDGYDLVLCGKQAIDDDDSQVGIMLAELCDMAHVSVVTDLEFDGNNFTATREIEGGSEVVKGATPALFTCQKGLNEPRLPSLPNIMKAGMKPVELLTCADLGIEVPAAHTEITTYIPPAKRGECKIIENEDPAAAAQELAKLLREEAKII